MADHVKEEIVVKRKRALSTLLYVIIWFTMLVSAFFGSCSFMGIMNNGFNLYALIMFVIFGGSALLMWFGKDYLRVEYEYSFTNGVVDVAQVINNRRRKELVSFKTREVEIVAHIARYHRRSGPKLSHVEFTSLARESRVVISKLAAILRVADALSRSRIKPIKAIRLERQDDDLTIYLPSQRPLILEERALDIKRDMFEDIYGLRIRLEEA